MKIALCQINTIVGDFNYNLELILKYYAKSIRLNADIIVFPELVITGYPPQDLLMKDSFIRDNLNVLQIISKKSTIPIIVGYVNKENGALYNSAAICYEGKTQYSCNKILLPTYDVFDEARYFNSGENPSTFTVPIGNEIINIGLQICEDMWDNDYETKVSKIQMEMGANILVNISASPYQKDRLQTRKSIIKEKVKETGLPFFYCNMVGAQDELIFDGQSVAFSSRGKLIGYANSFKQEILIVNIKSSEKVYVKDVCQEENIYSALCLGVKDYFKKTGHNEAVIGLSGGIDSALVASIATDALGSKNIHGISLPSKYSSNHSLTDAKDLANNLGIDYDVIPIQNGVDEIEKLLKPHFHDQSTDVTEENLQARMRGIILMALSNKFGWMVLSTGNKTELALGYCTLYGDMSGGLSVISDLNKGEVYKVAKWINNNKGSIIPLSIINKEPSAELSYGQVDPFDYSVISPLVDAVIGSNFSKKNLVEQGYDEKSVNLVYNKIRLNEYKRRQAAPGLKISSKAFGMGRRFPIVNNYRG